MFAGWYPNNLKIKSLIYNKDLNKVRVLLYAILYLKYNRKQLLTINIFLCE